MLHMVWWFSYSSSWNKHPGSMFIAACLYHRLFLQMHMHWTIKWFATWWHRFVSSQRVQRKLRSFMSLLGTELDKKNSQISSRGQRISSHIVTWLDDRERLWYISYLRPIQTPLFRRIELNSLQSKLKTPELTDFLLPSYSILIAQELFLLPTYKLYLKSQAYVVQGN